MSEPTQGPWKWIGPKSNTVFKCNQWLLCENSMVLMHGGDWPVSVDDALLIKAAPDMLEALKEIAKGQGRYSVDPMQHAKNTIEDMIELANDAIAKATRGGDRSE